MQFTIIFIKFFFYGISLAAPLLLSFVLTIVILGQIVGRKESWTRFDSLYWSFITATTVGYGDIRPTLKKSKILSILIAFLGLIFTGIVVALAINAATMAFTELNYITDVKSTLQKIK